MTLGSLFTVSGQTYKVTSIDSDTVWGSVVIDTESGKCRRGRPSKFRIEDVQAA